MSSQSVPSLLPSQITSEQPTAGLRLQPGPGGRSKPGSQGAKPKRPKPTPDFPLTLHPNGQWCKKIRGRQHFFGRKADPSGALERYTSLRAHLEAGKTMTEARALVASPPSIAAHAEVVSSLAMGSGHRQPAPAVALLDLANQFMHTRWEKVQNKQMSPRSYRDYQNTFRITLGLFGGGQPVSQLGPKDFERLCDMLAKGQTPCIANGRIGRARTLFKYAYDMDLVDRPLKYAGTLKRIKAGVVRRAMKARGPRTFSAQEIRTLLSFASVQMRAMILLGINGGLGNTDLAKLPRSAVNLDAGWLEFPRPKTGEYRRVPLWPDSVEALLPVWRFRPAPLDERDSDLVFLTRQGRPWVREIITNRGGQYTLSVCDAIGHAFKKLRQRAGVSSGEGRQQGLRGFYALRHTFATQADEAKDRPAARTIMGHAEGAEMMDSYVEGVSDARLRAVADLVRHWLFGADAPDARPQAHERG